jgi:hypothetical protein
MLWERISVGNHERVLVARNRRLRKILTPGEHTIVTPPFVSVEYEKHDTTEFVLRSKWSADLIHHLPGLREQHFICVCTNEVQVAMVYANGQLVRVLTPFSRILIWRNIAEIRVELVNVIGDVASEDEEDGIELPFDFAGTFH